ncbi:MAG: adenylate/guanylate cyclase domain-containing protein [Mycobacteriales bacterium]|nr:adenylate/guanylate cyclase domain-containing protein [Mycobacteriales bacterium]
MTRASAARVCAACGAPQAPQGPCAECGTASFEPQRRVVAVVFADLAGYTHLAASLDPEDVHLLIRPLMNGLRRACTDLGGSVPAIEGDGLMAVFGALRDSEDIAFRALSAAVAMQSIVADRRAAYGPELPSLRIGVNLGEVLVAPSWETDGFSVSGDAVNVGSRLCAVAGPDEVLVASALLTAVSASLRWSDEHRIEVRGRDLPVLARRLLWREGAVPDARRTPSTTRLLGRDDVLRAMDRVAGRVLLVGEPGVGKTRVAREWAARRQDVAGLRVLTAACPSFRAEAQVAAVAELACAVPAEWLAGLPEAAQRRLRRLRGEPVDSAEPDRVEDQVAALVNVLAQHRDELVVVIDDVHWATPVELRLLSSLLALDGLSVVATSRRDGTPALACPDLDVEPLTAEDSRLVVDQLLPGAPPELIDFLTARAGGVPLYLEQCARLLLEERTVEMDGGRAVIAHPEGLRRVPTVMRLFVTGRLDLLDGIERDVLAAASISGEAVVPDLLRHLCRSDIADVADGLVARGLLQWEASAAGPRLRFRHALVRDVAYESLTRARRVDQHRAAADWYSVRLPSGALAARAAHLEAALDLSQGLSAPDCSLARDTQMALLAHAHGLVQENPAASLAVLARVTALFEQYAACDLEQLDTQLLLAEVHELVGQHLAARKAAVLAHRLAVAAQDRNGEAHALLLHGMTFVLSDPERARELLDEAMAAYIEVDDAVGQAKVHIAGAYALQGDSLAQIAVAFSAAYDAARRAGDMAMAATAAQTVAFHAFLRGRGYLEEWLGHANALARPDDIGGRSRLLAGRALVDLAGMSPTHALAHAQEAVQLGESVGVRQVVSNAVWVATEAAVAVGDLELADALLEQGADHAAARPTSHQRFDVLVATALLRGRQGRPGEADGALQEASELAAELGRAYDRERAWCAAVRACETGRWEAAVPLLDQVLEADRAGDQPFLSLRPRVLRLQCQVMAGQRVSFSESDALQRDSREWGAPPVDAILQRWLEVDDLLKGERPAIALQLPPLPDLAEARAVDHLLHGLLDGDDARLVAAAAEWKSLGVTAWTAVPLVWHAHLFGEQTHLAEAREVLVACGAPDDAETLLRERLRSYMPRRTLGE